MNIKPPIKEKEESDNKCFHMEIMWNDLPFSTDKDTGWSTTLNEELRSDEMQSNSEFEDYFYNPNETHSIKPAKFLSYLNLNGGCRDIFPNYQPKNGHFHYPMEAMIKLIPYQRLSKLRWLTVVEERLKNNVDGCAEQLGFATNGNGEFIVPNRRTIGRFFTEYLGVKGHRKLFDYLLLRLKEKMDERRISFGKKVGVDSTPLETLTNDSIGGFNAYYFKQYGLGKMVKVHIAVCLDTGVPLAMRISGANTYDGNYLISFLKKLKRLGFDFHGVYGDNHYGTLKNWAKVPLMFNTKCYFSLAEGAVFREDGIIKNIQREYQKFWKEKDFIPQNQTTIEYILTYLLNHDKYVYAGAYYRNQFWKIREKNKHIYEYIRSRRNLCESLHGIMKEQLDMDKHLSGKGGDRIEIYALQFLITMVVVALIRIENGIGEGFTKVSEGVFS